VAPLQVSMSITAWLSGLCALCVAAVPDVQASRALFRTLLMWGLSMILVGAALCQLFAGWLAR